MVSEDDGGSQVSSSSYGYNALGERETVTISTPNGETRYKYSDYVLLGAASNQSRVFTKINKQAFSGGQWVNSGEEVRYVFDLLGRLKQAKFGLSPQNGQSNYDSFGPASYAAAEYSYDLVGRILSVEHNSYALSGQNYVKTAALLAISAEYNNPLGLKTATKFWNPSGTNVTLQRTETDGYDADFDYLTSVNYGDGSAAETWTYDAAGNRASASATPGAWTYDNLNRMVASPGATYSHDVLGNRTGKVSGGVTTSYSWDAVNRMDVYATTAGSSGYKNQYRADGMRVKKETGWTVSGSPGAYVVNDLGSGLQTRTYYDGQMPVEEDEGPRGGSVAKWTRNFVGARGIEAMLSFDGSVTSTAFPLYDCHGNMVATVARSGSGFSAGNVRTYDVWGGVRSGASTGGPRGRYVANLGHVVDDESGLIYMRARYYEPGSGRFISEDPARAGANWYTYCSNNPMTRFDITGRTDFLISLLQLVQTLMESIGLGFAIEKAMDKGAEFLARKLRTYGMKLIERGLEHQAAAAALAGRQDFLGKAAAGGQGKLGAKNLAAGLTLLSISNFIRYSDEFMEANWVDDVETAAIKRWENAD